MSLGRTSRILLAASIWLLTALAALLDFWTSEELIGSILFTFPLALCAIQRSKRLLWSTGLVAAVLTIAAQFWGIGRAADPISWDAMTSRGLLVVSLSTLTVFIHLWLGKNEEAAVHLAHIARQSQSLLSQNAQLELLMAAAALELDARQAAAEHLAGLERRARGFLEGAPDAMIVVDASGVIVLVNAQAERLYGYERNELVGFRGEMLTPERLRSERRQLRAAFNAEPGARFLGGSIDTYGLRRDGSEFPFEAFLSPLESPEGPLIMAAVRDISLRKAAEKRLALLEGRYRGLLEAAPDAMVLVNQAGEIVLVNRQTEHVFGYQRTELVGGSARKLVSAAGLDRMVAFTRRAADGSYEEQSQAGIELDGLHKDGSQFPIEATLSALQTTDEGILLAVAVRDISVRKQNEARLLQTLADLNRSNEELGHFAYIASHDLQEPLRMVASYTQLLAKRYSGKLDADADEFIGFAVDGANRMKRLIQDLLLYSRVGTTGQELQATSSEDALEQAIMNLGNAIEDSGASVTHDPLPGVLGDQGQLVQLFQNLVGNAIKYQGPGPPRIHISSAREGQTQWMFSVQDNGLGIEPKYFERIFGMFQRLHRREEFEGTGIGLAICKRIVERHGGSLAVESALGEGATFRFALRESNTR